MMDVGLGEQAQFHAFEDFPGAVIAAIGSTLLRSHGSISPVQ